MNIIIPPPSNTITSNQTGQFASVTNLGSTGSYLYTLITGISVSGGSASIPPGIVYTSGSQIITGSKTFVNNLGTSGFLYSSGLKIETVNSPQYSGTLITGTIPGNINIFPYNNQNLNGGYVDFGSGGVNLPNAPIRWGAGNKYALSSSNGPFNNRMDYTATWGYNPEEKTGDVSFGLGFEHWFLGTVGGGPQTDCSTEHYYYWNGVSGGSRRVVGYNTSLGVENGALHPAGWTDYYLNVETIKLGTGFDLVFDYSTGTFPTFNFGKGGNRAILNDVFIAGNVYPTGGAGPKFVSGWTISQQLDVVGELASLPSVLKIRNNAGADNGIVIHRGSSSTEQLRIGGAGSTGLFYGANNLFIIDRVSTSAASLRQLRFRRSATTGTSYVIDLQIGSTGNLSVGGGGTDDNINQLQVYGSSYFQGAIDASSGKFTNLTSNGARVITGLIAGANVSITNNNNGTSTVDSFLTVIPSFNATGNFNVVSGNFRYIWTGNATWTGIMPSPVGAYSGIQIYIKNKSSSSNLIISGNIDNIQNDTITPLSNFVLWADGQTWNKL